MTTETPGRHVSTKSIGEELTSTMMEEDGLFSREELMDQLISTVIIHLMLKDSEHCHMNFGWGMTTFTYSLL